MDAAHALQAVAVLLTGAGVAAVVIVAADDHDGSRSGTPLPAVTLRTTFVPTPAEAALALAAAHEQATHPGTTPSDTWPSTVRSVSYIGSTKREAMALVDGSASADPAHVIAVRMVGSFEIDTSGPPGHATRRGNVETLLVNLRTGDADDLALTTVPDVSAPTVALPAGATTVYPRPAPTPTHT